MAHLIDKDKVAAEIEKFYNECLKRTKIIDSAYWNAKVDAYRNVLVILNDALEVKEVNLDKEIDRYYNIEAPKEFEDVLYEDIEKFAKYFFELGLKAQKGE